MCDTSLKHRPNDVSDVAAADNGLEGTRLNRERNGDSANRTSACSMGAWMLVACAPIWMALTGCASMNGQSKADSEQTTSEVEKLKSRIQELERENGRLTTRIDQLEDDIFLLQDRVEAHRLALKRQRQQRRRKPRARRSQQPKANGGQGDSRAQRPQQPPSTHYQPRRRQSRRNVTRIQLNPNQSGVSAQPSSGRQRRSQQGRRRRDAGQSQPTSGQSRDSTSSSTESTASSSRSRSKQGSGDNADGSDETIVITNEDFEQYASAASGDKGGQSASSSDGAESSDQQGRAQPDVTDERLDTTGQTSTDKNTSDGAATGTSDSSGTAGRSGGIEDDAKLAGKEGLDLYKASLSLYRQGDYARARAGFKQYMKGNPRRDYQDNGLYWLGECEFGLGRYEKAISLFTRVIEDHPGGNKVPDAMLKMALAYREMGNEQRATQLLKKVASQYPRTNVGDLAERKMK